MTNVTTLTEYADMHGFDVKRLRRIARKNEFPGDVQPFKFGGKHGVWAINADAPRITLPPKSQRGARRADGRQRYIVFINTTDKFELTAIANIVGDDNIIDPRVVSRERRTVRKLANANGDETIDDGDYDDLGGHHG